MKYLIFDTETGGTDYRKDALMSVGLIVVDENLEEIARFYTLRQNREEKLIHEGAVAVNGIDPKLLESGVDGRFLGTIWSFLMRDVGCVIGHNIAFDLNFIRENGITCPEVVLDTMHVAWDVWQGQKAKLEMCYERIGKEATDAHNALYDCQMTLDLLRWFVENEHLKLPLPMYSVCYNYYANKAFGYKSLVEKGLVDQYKEDVS